LQEVIIWPNSEISSRREWKASRVILESISKSTLSKDMSLSHWKASNKPNASPTSTENTQGKLTILAKTKTPSASRRHIPILVRLWEEEKATSTLHLSRPGVGFCQATGCVSGVLASLEIEVARCVCAISVPYCPPGIFASFHSVTITRARSTTVAQPSMFFI